MNLIDALLHPGILPWQPGEIVPLAADTWFAIAALLTLWAYVTLAPDRGQTQA